MEMTKNLYQDAHLSIPYHGIVKRGLQDPAPDMMLMLMQMQAA